MKKNRLLWTAFLFLGGLTFVSYFRFSKVQPIQDERVLEISKMRDMRNEILGLPSTDYVIINFWATWCPPCIEETPSLVRFVEAHRAKLTLWALSQDTDKGAIERFLKTFSFPDSDHIRAVHDSSQNGGRSYGVDKLPETYIYSLKQNKYFHVSGSTNWDAPEVTATLNKFFGDTF